jgi:F-type H+-transporting ATPase subunit gamma
MANLNEIKKKIHGVKKTQQITKAMQLVAASKMQAFQKKAVHTRQYAWDLLDMLKNNLADPHLSSFLEQRTEGKTLFILYTSDKGLCGALNSQLMRALFQSNKWLQTPEDMRLLITIGKKATAYCKFNNIAVEKEYIGLDEAMTPYDSLEFVQTILEYWVEGGIKEVIMTAPHYKNSFTFYSLVKPFLPFSVDMVKEHLGADREDGKVGGQDSDGSTDSSDGPTHRSAPTNNFMYYEPSEDRLIEAMMEQLMQSLFLQGFYELKAAEYSSRMMAMQSATDNAGDLIKAMSLDYNKARQGAITQQLAELSGGMSAV